MKILSPVLILATAFIFSCADYPRIDEMERTPIYGADLIDSRNNQVYQTVIIGNQTWIAKNLNFPDGNSICYEREPDNCETYGRLYDWATAMGLDGKYNDSSYIISTKVKGICPSGWHLPSDAEWQTLVEYVGTNVGVKLKAKRGWSDETDNGDDIYGFSAMPSGNYEDGFHNLGNIELGYWWSSTESEFKNDLKRAYYRDIGWVNSNDMVSKLSPKSSMLAVRCIKN